MLKKMQISYRYVWASASGQVQVLTAGCQVYWWPGSNWNVAGKWWLVVIVPLPPPALLCKNTHPHTHRSAPQSNKRAKSRAGSSTTTLQREAPDLGPRFTQCSFTPMLLFLSVPRMLHLVKQMVHKTATEQTNKQTSRMHTIESRVLVKRQRERERVWTDDIWDNHSSWDW